MLFKLAWLIPLFPLIGSIINGVFGLKLGKDKVSWIACGFPAMSFFVTVILWVALFFHPEGQAYPEQILWTWMAAGDFTVEFGFQIDPLSMVMMLVVTGVGTIIHIFSIGYMYEEYSYYRYFSYLNLFLFSMLILVMGNNFLMMFIGWEGVGVCSYFLIGYYFEKKSACDASVKAFVVNRVGDFAFLLGVFYIFHEFGTIDFTSVFNAVPSTLVYNSEAATLITMFLFIGATGKSAQIPLYTWLPDAMEGPTPVSALIHAATMVTAGVYMVVRCNALFNMAPITMMVIALVGGGTALFAATIGCTQYDIKRVLAYSTVSQIGYMFLACGVGAYTAAIFHLVTHAFFKACLFLGSGSVIHGMHHEQDIRKMGGLKDHFPITYVTFLVSTIAIAGIFPFSGFFSKDEILYHALMDGNVIYWGMGVAGAFITAFYMFRLVFLTFHGPSRVDPHVHPHESPKVMTLPLIVLAGLALGGGLLGLPLIHGWHILHNFLEPVLSFDFATALHNSEVMQAEHGHHVTYAEILHEKTHSEHNVWLEIFLMIFSMGVALAGIFLAYLFYIKRPELPDEYTKGQWGYDLVKNKYLVDEAYDAIFVQPTVKGSYLLWKEGDAKGVDGAVNGVAQTIGWFSKQAREFQSGFVRNYAMFMVVGFILLLILI
ncbi:NADH-quinone oxidoreductase, subunit L [Nitrospina gracilis 3/211]|uniref:NADH-quinone oxidoreductase, subunit L n=1 Tax=Nitrospina gracilis (strain 3/211) TaxID=1266370 RepID=M1YL43_NITG3|nr:NADH-quinone oxidoreductase subunit L [Nitrospina gracilis]MCF8724036.1 NADH-quinone oxidoreductase subunit L [Nitrospina sp. Nb-3]CCQ91166.1 NADH-quinone oxidoreductase, subunit L [Nitrospina gracilis 3/211]